MAAKRRILVLSSFFGEKLMMGTRVDNSLMKKLSLSRRIFSAMFRWWRLLLQQDKGNQNYDPEERVNSIQDQTGRIHREYKAYRVKTRRLNLPEVDLDVVDFG